MVEQALTISDREVLSRIDKLRGEFSRQFFIELCVNSLEQSLGGAKEQPPLFPLPKAEATDQPVTDKIDLSEIPATKGAVNVAAAAWQFYQRQAPVADQPNGVYLDEHTAAISEAPVSVSTATPPVDVPVSDVPLVTTHEPVSVIEPQVTEAYGALESKHDSSGATFDATAASDSDARAPSGSKMLLWAAGALLFGFGDTLTSFLVFANGGIESNPVLATLLSYLGNSVWAFLGIKSVAFLILGVASFKSRTAWSWMIPLLVTMVGGFLVFNNLVVLSRLT